VYATDAAPKLSPSGTKIPAIYSPKKGPSFQVKNKGHGE
jgi:hypothetical protein